MLVTKTSPFALAHESEPDKGLPIPITLPPPPASSIIKNWPQQYSLHSSRPYNHALYIELLQRDEEGAKKTDNIAHGIDALLENLREIVAKDITSPPETRIDLVRLSDTGMLVENKIWTELAGLRPRRLEILTGYREECELDDISWPLESMYIGGMCSYGVFYPPAFAGLRSLTLEYCNGLQIHPEGGAKGLEHLEILNNNAIAMFSYFCENNPEVAETLGSLRLKSVSDLLSPDEFLSALRSLKVLRTLDLAMNDVDSLACKR